MKCHYEVLGIPTDADDATIKSAYKKLALKSHPDKNLENAEEAKEQFQIVQQAYEVLSDRQERAWYDNHRDQILRGSDSNFKDDSLNVFQYFTTTCFKGYGDDPKGFYTVYREVFEKIAKEDLEFMEDKDEFCQIPSFGNSHSDYDETVGPFYAYWSSYSTKKSYVWLDPYNINEIRDRKILKLVEKENKKVRQKAKKERNEEVRNLVIFVRKRDKRVQEHTKKIEAKILENRQKHEQISNQKRLERKKQHENHSVAEWSKFDNVKSELEEIERRLAEQFGEELSDDSEVEIDKEDDNNLYCVACNKIFKTAKAMQNHDASKKHKENLRILQEVMLEEENDISESSEEQENEFNEDLEKKTEKSGNDKNSEVLQTDDSNDDENNSDDNLPQIKTKKKSKKSRKSLRDNSFNSDLGSELLLPKDEIGKFSDDESNKGKKQKKSKAKKTPQKNLLDEAQKNDLEETSENSVKKKTNKTKTKNKKTKELNEIVSNIDYDVDIDHCCVICKSNFPSKNKLFDHLKTTGHSTFVPKEHKKKNKKIKDSLS